MHCSCFMNSTKQMKTFCCAVQDKNNKYWKQCCRSWWDMFPLATSIHQQGLQRTTQQNPLCLRSVWTWTSTPFPHSQPLMKVKQISNAVCKVVFGSTLQRSVKNSTRPMLSPRVYYQSISSGAVHGSERLIKPLLKKSFSSAVSSRAIPQILIQHNYTQIPHLLKHLILTGKWEG